ncbi:MAG: peroxiredoxin [Eubacteriales bacterium]|nr:peroxiredoxin [Eubacteriales bacterium]
MLQTGQPAPDFSLPDYEGNPHTLAQFRGKKVVLYFYPRDNTPGCTRQACAFKSAYNDFRAKDIAVIGISRDSQASHKKFIEKYELPFLLLSDPQLDAIKAYDVWQEKKMYGKPAFGVARATYVIDEGGVIEKVYEKASPDTNAADILAYIGTL